MLAELVIVRGAEAGRRIPLEEGETLIGRDPAAQLRLADQACGWRHCTLRFSNGAFHLTDFRTSTETLVNGIPVLGRTLVAGDRITIGKTVLVLRITGNVGEESPQRVTLLRASTLLYSFRALIASEDSEERARLEAQILQLVSDLVPAEDGMLLLASGEADLRALTRGRDPSLEALIARVCQEGVVADEGWVAVPLYARSALEGVLALRLAPEHADTMAAIATLASAALENALELRSLSAHNVLLREQIEPASMGIVGRSAAIQRVLSLAERVAPQDITVLILGESGTGKELIAHAIHLHSRRKARPFVAINCAAITDTLLESELFGHEKGAFTGAVVQKKGKLELAEGGTVFLDEIGELAPGLQAKLLRVLQQREFERVGGTRTMRLDVRLVAATNRDLAAEVRRGAFRDDLYHRLNVVALTSPPLRDRPEDVPLLARHFLSAASARCGRRVLGISPEAERCLLAYDWPGNVRELENAVERAVVLGQTEWVLPEDLPESVLETTPHGPFQNTLGEAKRVAILRAWQQAAGDYKAAAQLLGLHPNSLLRLIRNLGLRDELSRPS